MWIANFVYAMANTVLMTAWLMTGRWSRTGATGPSEASLQPT